MPSGGYSKMRQSLRTPEPISSIPDTLIAAGAILSMALSGTLLLVAVGHEKVPTPSWWITPVRVFDLPLIAMLFLGGGILVGGLLRKLARGKIGSDLLAGVSIVTAVLLGEYLAGVLVVLMLSGGEALEKYAVRRAGDVLAALARRMPTKAHRKTENGLVDVALSAVHITDTIVVLPHEICPVDGTVVAGRGSMDESYLTGEPYRMAKAPGSTVLSGAINGQAALEIRTERVASDSRYAKIMDTLRASEDRRPQLRRLADTLGALYTPLAIVLALAAWSVSGDATRFLAVLVVATPCPLLIAIPVAILGAVSLAAKRGIVIRDPAILERIATCRTVIFDKTGTLTYGMPQLNDVVLMGSFDRHTILSIAASLEEYSKHPLAAAVVNAAKSEGIPLLEVAEISEHPGQGLRGIVAGKEVAITSRMKLTLINSIAAANLPAVSGGLECILLIKEIPAALLRFRDSPRADGAMFIHHLAPRHGLSRVMIVSGDRESEVRWLADLVGIKEIHAGISPEGKLALIERETSRAPTIFVGDGINDAPALAAATVGIAMGASNDVTSEASGAVVMDSELERVDELFHIGQRLRRIALQSAVGGMAASVVGMGFASFGYLPPAAGALVQEIIDIVAVVNALRVGWHSGTLTDYGSSPSSAEQ